MHFNDAVEAMANLTSEPPSEHWVRFVTPIQAAVVAAISSRYEGVAAKTMIANHARTYAENCGLLATLAGHYQFPQRFAGKQGYTYTKLTRLSSHSEVDRCNQIINDLIFEQLQKFGCLADHLAKAVGELHDNVASHASGLGYSCAQVYNEVGGGKRIEIAVVDTGCGMLRNVQRILPTIQSHEAAMNWCMERGNTTAKPVDAWAQRLPDDAYYSPYPDKIPTRTTEDHHIGEGLWKLSELLKNVDGKLWAMSGDGEVLINEGKQFSRQSRTLWEGVAIEFQVIIANHNSPSESQQAGIERLAQRVGL